MNDNVDLLVERLHAIVRDLLDPAYCGHEPQAVFANKCSANEILVAMYGGVKGSEYNYPEAVDRSRLAQHMKFDYPSCAGTVTTP